jgi:hypothetical protein
MVKRVMMQCPERARLLNHLERTAQAFAEAVGGLRDLHGYDLMAQERLVAHIRDACDGAHAAWSDHQKIHGCGSVAVDLPAEPEPVRR